MLCVWALHRPVELTCQGHRSSKSTCGEGAQIVEIDSRRWVSFAWHGHHGNDVEDLGLYVEACHVCFDRDGSDSFQLYQVFVILSPFISSSPVGYEGFGNFAWRFAISSSRHLPGSPLARCTRQPTGAGESFEWLDILSTRHSCGAFAVPYHAIPSHVNMHPWGCYRLIWRNVRASKTGVMAWSIQNNMIMHEH